MPAFVLPNVRADILKWKPRKSSGELRIIGSTKRSDSWGIQVSRKFEEA